MPCGGAQVPCARVELVVALACHPDQVVQLLVDVGPFVDRSLVVTVELRPVLVVGMHVGDELLVEGLVGRASADVGVGLSEPPADLLDQP